MDRTIPTHGYIDEGLRKAYDAYVDNIMRGVSPHEAALRVGLLPEKVEQWVRAAECDPYIIERKRAAMKTLDARTVWSAETAVIHLLRLVESPYTKDSAKVMAIDRLNVLLGITIIDDKGNTRKIGRTLADFYEDVAGSGAVPGAQHDVQRH
ncbi:hypothetical protein [Trinickia sp.]|uniref:hypothetical protein n=1 Tax=Trinickia sp. TaxID=2571163 RepID=UPI003F81B4EA